MKTLENLLNRSLSLAGVKLSRLPKQPKKEKPQDYAGVRSFAAYTPWNTDAEFQKVYEKVREFTLVDELRCYCLWSLVRQTAKLSEGALIEVGVWRGGSGGVIAEQARLSGVKDKVYLCDTFSGVVKAGSLDPFYEGGEHADTSRQTVEQLIFDKLQLKNVQILQGIFPDETAAGIPGGTVRLCHVDVDVYQSAKDIFDWVWPRLIPGGVVVFDDYGFDTCQGIRQFVDEVASRNGLVRLYNLTGQAVLIKTHPGDA